LLGFANPRGLARPRALPDSVLAACATSAQIEVKSHPDVDFAAFRTYAWLPKDEERKPDGFAQNAAADRRLRQLIDGHLATKGLTKTDGSPDIYVTYVTGIKDSLGETVWGQGYGASRPGGGGATYNRRDATIVIDLIQGDPRELVWRGWAKVTIDQFKDADPIAVKALDRLFAKYPPK